MPKLIDYPRTSYTSAWEVAEVVDDTGGKCALETCARKLNRKVSGSFKAIVGSAVKFGLLTSKREQLTTTTLFRRIKHAYDKQEELLFHREAFLTPALFAQICRKFRTRELPVAMLDVLLIREFDVEEINAQNVAKAFVDGARMVGILDEHNIVADIDQSSSRQAPRRELASPELTTNSFRQSPASPVNTSGEVTGASATSNANQGKVDVLNTELANASNATTKETTGAQRTPVATSFKATPAVITTTNGLTLPPSRSAPSGTSDAIATLFGLPSQTEPKLEQRSATTQSAAPDVTPGAAGTTQPAPTEPAAQPALFRLQLSGPGINTDLEVSDADDLLLVRALLDKIERQLRRS